MKGEKKKINKRKEYDLVKLYSIILFCIFSVAVFLNYSFLGYLCAGFSKVEDKSMQVYFLNVGQASATMVVLPNRETLIYDTGSIESSNNFVDSVGLILRQNKLSKINHLILSHSDADHVGGVVKLLKKFEILNIYRPKIMSTSANEIENTYGYKVVNNPIYNNVITAVYAEPNCDVKFVENRTIVSSIFRLKVYAGKLDTYSQTNAYSPFVLMSFYDKNFLLTGDATAQRETEFIEEFERENIKIDFLQVAHHGAKSSTTAEFLAATNPTYAFVSAGDDTHPSQEVVSRLKDVGVSNIYCTKTAGMIGVGVNEDGVTAICVMANSVDLPLFYVCISLVLFAILQIRDKYHIKKRQNNYFKNRYYAGNL